MSEKDFKIRNGITSVNGNTVLGNTSVSVLTASGNVAVSGKTTFSNTVTGPGITTNLDGFLIDCGTYS